MNVSSACHPSRPLPQVTPCPLLLFGGAIQVTSGPYLKGIISG